MLISRKKFIKSLGLIGMSLVFSSCSGSNSNVNYSSNTNNNNGSDTNSLDPDWTVATLEEYNQITTGMTYDEVVEIFGGEAYSYSTSSSVISGVTYVYKSYTWLGAYDKNDSYRSATITFTNGRVSYKGAYNLI